MAEEGSGSVTINTSTLYKKCLSVFVSNLNYNVDTLNQMDHLGLLPPIILIDIYVEMTHSERLKNMLHVQLSDLEIFSRLLRINSTRQGLFHCVSSLMSSNKPIATQLQNNYIMRYGLVPKIDEKLSQFPATASETITRASQQIFSEDFDMNAIEFGLRLGSFLSEAGWLSESINILSCVASRLEKLDQTSSTLLVRLDCLQRLIYSEALLCSFKSHERIYNQILELINEAEIEKIPSNLLINIYIRLSVLFFSRSEYNDSLHWSISALTELKPTTPEKIVVDVLRQAAKSCVVKREFKRANMLISQAVRRARITFGRQHQKYADALLDNGFVLLTVGTFDQSVNAYKEALEIKQHIFGHRNFQVAIAHKDLSYAYYVHEYSSGDFQHAGMHIEKAIDIMKNLVPSNHLMLASAKRVKALLFEEIALGTSMVRLYGYEAGGLLQDSEDIHQKALQLSLEAFGEHNLQTAKQYGNLGRLYQTMKRFNEAEKMHKKAIKIKSDILGPYDYEVGLSLGQLASLYNYHMRKYREAEQLYLRSIDINLNLFGRTYSGLEYDYMGLIHLYNSLDENAKYLEYDGILQNWRALRRENEVMDRTLYPELRDDTSLEEVKKFFFEMCSDATTNPTCLGPRKDVMPPLLVDIFNL